MDRRVLGVIVVAGCLLPGLAAAQVTRGSATSPGITFHPPAEPATQDQPAQTSDRSHHSHGDRSPSPPSADGDLFRARPGTYAPRYGRRNVPPRPLNKSRRYHVATLPFGYFLPGDYPVVFPVASQLPALSKQDGYLRLQVEPGTAEVYVDGVYVGTVDEFNASWRGRALDAGRHSVEVRAAGFETVTFDVRILPDETVTYRRQLGQLQAEPRTDPVVTVAQVPPPKTLYVIPRCYAGDKPPVASQLPSGCDVGAVRIVSSSSP